MGECTRLSNTNMSMLTEVEKNGVKQTNPASTGCPFEVPFPYKHDTNTLEEEEGKKQKQNFEPKNGGVTDVSWDTTPPSSKIGIFWPQFCNKFGVCLYSIDSKNKSSFNENQREVVLSFFLALS